MILSILNPKIILCPLLCNLIFYQVLFAEGSHKNARASGLVAWDVLDSNESNMDKENMVGSLLLVKEKIFSSKPKRKEKENIFFSISIPISLLGFSNEKSKEIYSSIEKIMSGKPGRDAISKDFPEVHSKLLASKPQLTISRNGIVNSICDLSIYTDNWVIFNQILSSSKKETVNLYLRANTLNLDSDEHGNEFIPAKDAILSCVGPDMQKAKLNVKDRDIVTVTSAIKEFSFKAKVRRSKIQKF